VSAAVAFGSLVHAGALAAALRRRGLWRPDRRLASRLGRAAAATAVMALALDGALAAVGSVGIPALAGLCLGGLALYASAAWLLGAVTRADLAAARKTG
jgi:putative peptidoglycan lipid II flippase